MDIDSHRSFPITMTGAASTATPPYRMETTAATLYYFTDWKHSPLL